MGLARVDHPFYGALQSLRHPRKVAKRLSAISRDQREAPLRRLVALLTMLGLVYIPAPNAASAAEPTKKAPATKTDRAKRAAQKRKAAAREAAEKARLARQELIKSVRVIQRRPFLHAMRFELQLLGGIGLADRMYKHAHAAAHGRFHIDEAWSVGAGYTHYFNFESALLTSLTTDYELYPERSLQRFYAGIDVGFAPIFGKFAAFDSGLVHFDLYITLGGGVIQTSRSADIKPVGSIGVGWRLMITKWFTFVVEFKDHIYVENFNRGDEVVNNLILQAGFSFFIPFDYDYKYPR